MTIDDFDVNEISDKLFIRDETAEDRALEAAHDDAHNDFTVTGCIHDDVTWQPSHNDNVVCNHHDDGHYDIFDDCCCCFNDIQPKDI